MTLIEKDMTFFFTSNGANHQDKDGSRFEITLNTPIDIPRNAIDVSVQVTSANIWFTQPNIDEKYKNNELVFFDDFTKEFVSIILPKGLYGVDELNERIEHELHYNSKLIGLVGDGCIKLSSDSATQKIRVHCPPRVLLYTNKTAYPNNIAEMLGFTSYEGDHHGEEYLQSVNAKRTKDGSFIFEGSDVAKLNAINSFLLHGDLVKRGIQVNDTQANVMAEIQIDTTIGHLIHYKPYHPFKLDGTHLTLDKINRLQFWLTNEKNQPVDMNGEDYSFSVLITYNINIDHIMTQGRLPQVT